MWLTFHCFCFPCDQQIFTLGAGEMLALPLSHYSFVLVLKIERSALLHLGHPFFSHSSFHTVLTSYALTLDWMRAPMSSCILTINRLIAYWLFFFFWWLKTNKSHDTIFHTPKLILDSIYFGYHYFRTRVGKTLPVFINAVLLTTATLLI